MTDARKIQPPTSWYGELDPVQRWTLGACLAGWAMDAFDVQLYAFMIPALITTLGITRGEAGALQVATLITSAIGGWMAGYLADRLGRVRMMQFAILCFAVFTFLSGLAQTYGQLFLCRTLMGFGFGAEGVCTSELLSEVVAARHRGKAMGVMQAGWAVGWAGAALISTLAFEMLPQEAAWRALFMVGLAPALLIFAIRRYVPESGAFEASRLARKRGGADGAQPLILAIYRGPLARSSLSGALMTTGAQGGYFAVTTWLPTFLRTPVVNGGRGMGIVGSGSYLAVLIASSLAGYLGAALLSDRFGRRPTIVGFGVTAFCVVLLYTQPALGPLATLLLGAPLGFFASGMFAVIGVFLAEQFPTEVRGLGQGFTYNFGRAIGAFSPLLVGHFADSAGIGQAIGVFAGASYALLTLAALALPETRGRAL